MRRAKGSSRPKSLIRSTCGVMCALRRHMIAANDDPSADCRHVWIRSLGFPIRSSGVGMLGTCCITSSYSILRHSLMSHGKSFDL